MSRDLRDIFTSNVYSITMVTALYWGMQIFALVPSSEEKGVSTALVPPEKAAEERGKGYGADCRTLPALRCSCSSPWLPEQLWPLAIPDGENFGKIFSVFDKQIGCLMSGVIKIF
jgi:hypothetical protein